MSNPALTNYTNGINQVSSDNLNSFMQTCTDMAQLRGFPGNNTAITVYVRGTTSVNDGGQGTFYWNAGVTGTDDNGVTTVVPNGVTLGCWTRQPVGTTLLATSVTSNTIGTGTKTFTISQTSTALTVGGFVVIVSRANIANYMHGQVTSYSGNTLIVNVTDTGGSGTFADWDIILSGTQGSAGANPAFNTITNGTNTTAAMVVGTGSSLSVSGSGTIAATSSLVTNALASASTTVNVSAATAPSIGQILTATSSTTATWQNAASNNSAMILLDTQTASGSPIIFDNTKITGSYDNYRIIGNNISGSGSGTTFLIDLAVANTYGTLAYSYNMMVNGTGSSTSTSGVPLLLGPSGTMNTSKLTRCWIDLTGLTSNIVPSGLAHTGETTNFIINSFIVNSGAAVINGIKLYTGVNALATGTFKLYGIL